MSNLVPTPIVDKNGKRTTVRRKLATSQTNSKLTNIKPSISPEVDPLEQLSAVPGTAGYMLRVALTKKSYKVTPRMLNKMFEELQPDTIDALDRIKNEHPSGWHVVQNAAVQAAKKRTFSNLNNLALFLDDVFAPNNIGEMNSYVMGLHAHLPETQPIVDYSREPAEVQKSTRAVLRAAMELKWKVQRQTIRGDIWAYIASPNLEDLIRQRPDDVDSIIAILNQRKEMKAHAPDEIATLIDILDQNLTRTLIDGAL